MKFILSKKIIFCFAILFCVVLVNQVQAQVWIKSKNVPKKKKDDFDYPEKKSAPKKQDDDEHITPIGTVQLTASFLMNKREMCPTDSVKLSYRGNAKSFADVFYNWQIPDSSILRQAATGVFYLHIRKPGVYRISIKITGDESKYRASKIYTDSIEVLAPPNASFEISKQQICRGEYVDMQYTGSKKNLETYTNYSWSFDGGFPITEKTSLKQTVFWDIACKGNGIATKTVKLSTTNQDGCTSTTQQKIKVVAPDARISVSNEHPCNGEELDVKAITCVKDNDTKYIWNFGSGIDANPSIEGASQKVVYYNITEMPTSDMIKLQTIQLGCYSNIDSVFLDIYPLILADFTVNQDTLHSGGTVNFNIGDVFACDGGGEIKYQWKFPEGNILSSKNNKEVAVQFNNAYGSPVIFYPSLYIVQDKCKSRPYSMPIYVSPESAQVEK